jgi:hypothetical protein
LALFENTKWSGWVGVVTAAGAMVGLIAYFTRISYTCRKY